MAGWAQNTASVYLSGGATYLPHESDSANLPIANGLGLQVGGTYLHFLNDHFGLGGGLELGLIPGKVEWRENGVRQSIAANRSAYYLNRNPNTNLSYQLESDYDIRQNIRLSIVNLVIPFVYQFDAGYIKGGFKYILPVNQKFSAQSSSQAQDQGDFSEHFPDTDPDWSVVLGDSMAAWGFGNNQLGEVEGSSPFQAGMAWFVSPGWRFPVGSQTAFVELVLQGSLGNLRQEGGLVQNYDDRLEGEQTQYPLSSQVRKLSIRYYGVALGTTFGRLPTEDKNPPPLEALPILISQQINKRREAETADPEFKVILGDTIAFVDQNMRFSGADRKTHPAGHPNNGVLYVNLEKENLQNLRGRFDPDNRDFVWIGEEVRAGSLNVVLAPTRPSAFPVEARDEQGRTVNDLKARLFFQEKEIWQGRLDSGQAIPHVYRHPSIEYRLELSHECFETQDYLIKHTSSFTRGWQAQLASKPSRLVLEVPKVCLNPLLASSPVLQGYLVVDSKQVPLQGKVENNRLILDGGCAQELDHAGTFTMIKPHGINIQTHKKSSDWKEAEVEVGFQNGVVADTLLLERAATPFNLYYVDISEADDYQVIMDTLEKQLLHDIEQKEDFLGFISNGRTPVIVSEVSAYEDLLYGINKVERLTPNAAADKARLIELVDVDNLLPDRRKVRVKLFLSQTINKLSRDILVRQFLESLGEDVSQVEVTVYHYQAIPAAEKIDAISTKGGTQELNVEYRPIK
jgi:hypothetical protein